MKCIIKVDESGNTADHPILISNFLDVYPDLDISGNTAPPGFAWFTRKNRNVEFLRNTPETHKVATRYVKTDEGFEDDHFYHELTEEQKAFVSNRSKGENTIKTIEHFKYLSEYNIENLEDSNEINTWIKFHNLIPNIDEMPKVSIHKSLTTLEDHPDDEEFYDDIVDYANVATILLPRLPLPDANGVFQDHLDSSNNWVFFDPNEPLTPETEKILHRILINPEVERTSNLIISALSTLPILPNNIMDQVVLTLDNLNSNTANLSIAYSTVNLLREERAKIYPTHAANMIMNTAQTSSYITLTTTALDQYNSIIDTSG